MLQKRHLSSKLQRNRPKELKLNTKEQDKLPYLKLNKEKPKKRPLESRLKS